MFLKRLPHKYHRSQIARSLLLIICLYCLAEAVDRFLKCDANTFIHTRSSKYFDLLRYKNAFQLILWLVQIESSRIQTPLHYKRLFISMHAYTHTSQHSICQESTRNTAIQQCKNPCDVLSYVCGFNHHHHRSESKSPPSPNAFYLRAICVKIEIESSKSDQFKTNSDSGNNHAHTHSPRHSQTRNRHISDIYVTNEQKGWLLWYCFRFLLPKGDEWSDAFSMPMEKVQKKNIHMQKGYQRIKMLRV